LHAAVSLVPPRTCRGILLRESCPSPASLACRPWGPACRRRWADPFFFFAGGFFLLCPLLRRSTAVEQLPAALCTVGDSVRVVLLVSSALWCVSGLELPHAWRAACPPHASRLLWCPGFFRTRHHYHLAADKTSFDARPRLAPSALCGVRPHHIPLAGCGLPCRRSCRGV